MLKQQERTLEGKNFSFFIKFEWQLLFFTLTLFQLKNSDNFFPFCNFWKRFISKHFIWHAVTLSRLYFIPTTRSTFANHFVQL